MQPDTVSPERSDLEQAELREQLQSALGELPEAEREAVSLCHIGGLTQQQASLALGIPLNTVKSHAKRGLERLRRRLEPKAANLEAYLASVVFLPPAEGWDLASVRWSTRAQGAAAAGALSGLAMLAVGLLVATLIVVVAVAAPEWTAASAESAQREELTPTAVSLKQSELVDGISAETGTLDSTPVTTPRIASPLTTAVSSASRTPPTDQPLGATTTTFVAGEAGSLLRIRTHYYASGAVYMQWGELDTPYGVQLEGPFHKYFPDGSPWENSDFKSGLREGPWITYHENGALACEGYFAAGLPGGRWTWFFDDSQKMAAGEFRDGLKVGKWQGWHANGALSFTEHYQTGKRSGVAKQYDQSGALVSEGDWENGLLIRGSPFVVDQD